jgi:lipopolysaccharide biosynthesis glycosyltransferase
MGKVAETVEDAIARISRLSAPDQIVAAVDSLNPKSAKHNYLEFLAGRALLELRRVDLAVARLKSSVNLNDKFPWAHYELARAFSAAGEHSNAIRSLLAFLKGHTDPLSPAYIEACEKVADAAVGGGLAQEAMPLYGLILHAGSSRYLTLVRAFESAIQQGDLELATRLRSSIGTPRDGWAHLAFAWHSAISRNTGDVADHLLKAQELLPGNLPGASRTAHLLRYLPGARALALWAKFNAQWAESFSLEDQEALKLEAGRVVLDPGEIQVDLRLALKSSRLQKYHVIDYLYLRAASVFDAEGAELLSAITKRFGTDADMLECIANVQIVNRQYDDARTSCLRAIELTGDPKKKFQFKLFEIECFDNNLEYADELLKDIKPESLGPLQRLMIARMRAEQGEWDAAAAILETLVTETEDYSAELVDLAVRTARKTGTQSRFVAAASGKPPSDSRERLLSALLEDWALRPRGASEVAKVLKSTGLEPSPMLAFKMEVVAPTVAAKMGQKAKTKRAIFYCADQGYVLPALVSMVSLLETNPSLHAADYFVAVDDAVAKQVQTIATRIGKYFGVDIEVVKSSTLSSGISKLNARYGIFTGGHQLAKSAYYRIYLARILAETGKYGELLYIDSDTLVLDGFEDVFRVERDPKTLLMARYEIDRPEIRKATAVHGLSPGTYFNSGILYFASLKAQTISRLKEAERLAEREPQRLIFQDQCALNLAFKGTVEPLPADYNYFVAPNKASAFGSVERGEPKLVHTLDRPKPWDSLYPHGTSVQRLWINAVRSVSRIAGAENVNRMFEWTFGR